MERTGIPKLKTGYNRVFGYYIEVSNSYKSQCARGLHPQADPDKRRAVHHPGAERPGGNRILGAHDKSILLETKLFEQVRDRVVAQQLPRVQASAKAVAAWTCSCSFARVSREKRLHPAGDQPQRPSSI